MIIAGIVAHMDLIRPILGLMGFIFLFWLVRRRRCDGCGKYDCNRDSCLGLDVDDDG